MTRLIIYILNFYSYFTLMAALPACISVYHICVSSVMKARGRCQIDPLELELQRLWAAN